jgi:hypothetical protein
MLFGVMSGSSTINRSRCLAFAGAVADWNIGAAFQAGKAWKLTLIQLFVTHKFQECCLHLLYRCTEQNRLIISLVILLNIQD